MPPQAVWPVRASTRHAPCRVERRSTARRRRVPALVRSLRVDSPPAAGPSPAPDRSLAVARYHLTRRRAAHSEQPPTRRGSMRRLPCVPRVLCAAREQNPRRRATAAGAQQPPPRAPQPRPEPSPENLRVAAPAAVAASPAQAWSRRPARRKQAVRRQPQHERRLPRQVSLPGVSNWPGPATTRASSRLPVLLAEASPRASSFARRLLYRYPRRPRTSGEPAASHRPEES